MNTTFPSTGVVFAALIFGLPFEVFSAQSKQNADPGLTPRSSIGLKPLTEMSKDDRYKGEDGGLYGGGKNEPPPTLAAAARVETTKIVPLDSSGKPSAEGKIVLASIGMSHVTMDFSVLKRLANADPQKSPNVALADLAQGGQTMEIWANPNAKCWTQADRRLADADISPEQVQIAWVKLANKFPTGDLREHGAKLQRDTILLLQNARTRFPNLRIVYLDSRSYAGYATAALNPEPYAYETGFVVRWLIQAQINGESALNFDPARGPIKAPLLLWGPYLWADGMTPRKADGLVWRRDDYRENDGTHPTEAGKKKVADQLLNFFKTDPFARTWFVARSH